MRRRMAGRLESRGVRRARADPRRWHGRPILVPRAPLADRRPRLGLRRRDGRLRPVRRGFCLCPGPRRAALARRSAGGLRCLGQPGRHVRIAVVPARRPARPRHPARAVPLAVEHRPARRPGGAEPRGAGGAGGCRAGLDAANLQRAAGSQGCGAGGRRAGAGLPGLARARQELRAVARPCRATAQCLVRRGARQPQRHWQGIHGCRVQEGGGERVRGRVRARLCHPVGARGRHRRGGGNRQDRQGRGVAGEAVPGPGKGGQHAEGDRHAAGRDQFHHCGLGDAQQRHRQQPGRQHGPQRGYCLGAGGQPEHRQPRLARLVGPRVPEPPRRSLHHRRPRHQPRHHGRVRIRRSPGQDRQRGRRPRQGADQLPRSAEQGARGGAQVPGRAGRGKCAAGTGEPARQRRDGCGGGGDRDGVFAHEAEAEVARADLGGLLRLRVCQDPPLPAQLELLLPEPGEPDKVLCLPAGRGARQCHRGGRPRTVLLQHLLGHHRALLHWQPLRQRLGGAGPLGPMERQRARPPPCGQLPRAADGAQAVRHPPRGHQPRPDPRAHRHLQRRVPQPDHRPGLGAAARAVVRCADLPRGADAAAHGRVESGRVCRPDQRRDGQKLRADAVHAVPDRGQPARLAVGLVGGVGRPDRAVGLRTQLVRRDGRGGGVVQRLPDHQRRREQAWAAVIGSGGGISCKVACVQLDLASACGQEAGEASGWGVEGGHGHSRSVGRVEFTSILNTRFPAMNEGSDLAPARPRP